MSDDVFPDVRWGSDRNLLRKPATAFASTTFGSWLIRSAVPLDRRLLHRSHGRFTVLGPIGAPTVLLTTTGRKSGQPRTSPLLYIRDNGRFVVVGSNFGQSTHPAWTANLSGRPQRHCDLGQHDCSSRRNPRRRLGIRGSLHRIRQHGLGIRRLPPENRPHLANVRAHTPVSRGSITPPAGRIPR